MMINNRKFIVNGLIRAFLLLMFCSQSFADDIVLFDVEITPEKYQNKSDTNIYSSVLQEGLQEKYDSVYYGPAVQEKLKIEYEKEQCTPEECSQNVVLNFGTNLMIEATVSVEDKGYITTMKIIDITDPTKSISKTDACLPCTKSQFIQRLKLFGAGQTARFSRKAKTPKPKLIATVKKNFILFVESIEGEDAKEDNSVISDKATRLGLLSQFYPNKWAGDLIKGFGIKLGGADNKHNNPEFGEATSTASVFGGLLYFNKYIGIGYQVVNITEPVKFGFMQNENTTIGELVFSLQYLFKNIYFNLSTYVRVGENIPFSDTAFSSGLGYKF